MAYLPKHIKNHSLFVILLFINLWFLSIPVYAELQFERVGDSSLISGNVVTDIAQDTQGYLWVATAAGVIRHDGYRFKLFKNEALDPTTLGGNFVRNINVFDDGTIWFSTETAGVSIYHPESEIFSQLFDKQTFAEHPNLSSVSMVISGPNGSVWLATGGGVYRATSDGEIVGHHSVDNGLPHNSVRALLRDKDDNIWAGTRAGLVKYQPQLDKFIEVLPKMDEGRSISIRSLFEASDGRIWVGTNSSGVWIYDPTTSDLEPGVQNEPDQYASNTVYDIFEASDEEIWAARFGGIDRIASQSGDWLSRMIHDPSDSVSLANNDIRTMLKDQSGVIWIGGYGSGLQRTMNHSYWLKTFRFSLLRENALTEPNISSVLALSNGLIWAGTRGNGINIIDPDIGVIGGYSPKVGSVGKLQAGWITALSEHSNGDIWVGANPGQLYRFDSQTETFHLYTQEQGLPRGNIRALKPSTKGGMWVGTNSGLVYWDNQTDRFETFMLEDQTPMRGGINALHEDENGHLLVASGNNGLLQVTPENPFLEPIKGIDENGESLASMSILGMLKASDGRLWIDTSAGLYLVTIGESGQATLDNHSLIAGFSGEPMGANLLEDSAGRIWTPNFIYDPAHQQMVKLQKADGVDIGTSWFRSYTKTAEGAFLYGGSRGLLMIEPDNYQAWDYKPPPVVSELRIDGQEFSTGLLAQNGLTVEPTQRTVSIEFSALDLSAPEKNLYRYKLQGFDPDWIEVDATRRVASYSNLWPGDYVFLLEATNRAGQWSDQQYSFNISVKAAYWQTSWFAMLTIIFVASLMHQAYRLRTRFIKAKARELESEVQQRTQELRQTQQDFIEQEKMASLGGLVAGVSHEINTPMGIALTAATTLDDDCTRLESKVHMNSLKRSELNNFVEKAHSTNKIILSSLERACSLISSFKQLAVDQTSEQRRQFQLHTLLQDIERSLRPLYVKSGHTLEVSCPDDISLESYPGAIFQILTNLISNSTLHGFTEKQQGTITITAETEQDQICLHYRDDGVGMSEEAKKKAFEPFYTTKRGAGGSGLGLYLVYNYVSQILGGKIRIESSPGKGFMCKIQIPFTAPQHLESE